MLKTNKTSKKIPKHEIIVFVLKYLLLSDYYET